VVVAVVATSCASGKAKGKAASPSTTGVTVAAGTSTTVAAPVEHIPPVTWKSCNDGLQCATITVPLDHLHPDGRTVGIAIARLPATGKKIGSLLFNPGGPGEAGVDFLRTTQDFFMPDLRARFDIVGFDPRGAGVSQPLQCEDGPTFDKYIAVDPVPDEPGERQAIIDSSKELASNCGKAGGDLLGFVDTVSVARDMDDIRMALGEDKLDYAGFSYGTFLGATYAELFPTRIRSMMLDGALDPSLSVDDVSHQQAVGFENELGDMLKDCAADKTCPFKTGGASNAKASFMQLMQSIDAHPLTVAKRTLGPGEAFIGVLLGLYSKSFWPTLERALAAAAKGDGSVLLALSDAYTQRDASGHYSPTLSANFAVNCIDRPSSTDLAVYDNNAKAWAADAPFFGPAVAYGGVPCAYWPVKPVGVAHPIHAPGAPPIVIVGTTGDPATPFAWAQSLNRQIAGSVLITHKGEGHTGYRDSACVRQKVDAYFIDLTLPPAGTTCT
jgi:pimeloyl-ACP methyl ester carboxylesterase